MINTYHSDRLFSGSQIIVKFPKTLDPSDNIIPPAQVLALRWYIVGARQNPYYSFGEVSSPCHTSCLQEYVMDNISFEVRLVTTLLSCSPRRSVSLLPSSQLSLMYTQSQRKRVCLELVPDEPAGSPMARLPAHLQ